MVFGSVDLEASEEVVILLTMGSAGRDLLMLSGLARYGFVRDWSVSSSAGSRR